MWLPTCTFMVPFEDDVQLLASMGGELDGHVLLGLLIGHGNKEGLGSLVLEQRGPCSGI